MPRPPSSAGLWSTFRRPSAECLSLRLQRSVCYTRLDPTGSPLDKTEKNTSNVDAAVKPTAEAPRRAYVAPQLRYLGTVRDLSLGSSAGVGENKNMRMPGTM